MSSKHCHEIDYLRIIGAWSVLLYHYTFRSIQVDGVKTSLFPCFEIMTKYGYLGVNLFFIISGFVILFSTNNRNAFNFAFARADRLYPAYWACVTISSIAIFIFDGSLIPMLSYFANLTMINDYLNVTNIDGVYWTLHVELKFYFLIFILILTNVIRKYYVFLSIWLFLSYTYYFTGQPFFMGWVISPYYSSFFISGISIYLLYLGKNSIGNIVVLFLSIILSIAYTWEQGEGFIKSLTDQDRIVACCIMTLIYLLFIIIAKKQFIKLRIPIVARLSALTYSIYLLHASVGKRLFDNLVNDFLLNKHIALLVTILFILILSDFVNRLVERPFSGKIKRLGEWFLTIFVRKKSSASKTIQE